MSGLIATDTEFNINDNPVIIIDDLTIKAGVTVTIEAGTIFKFRKSSSAAAGPTSHVDIIVNGTLKVNGTEQFPVKFMSEEGSPLPSDWGSIFFSDTASDSSIVTWASFEHAYCTLKIDTSNPSFENCSFKKSDLCAAQIIESNARFITCTFSDIKNPPATQTVPYAIQIEGAITSSPLIKGCLFENNQAAIIVKADTLASIVHNEFKNNTFGIKVTGASSSPEIKGNNFIANTTAAVFADTGLTVDAAFNRWESNASDTGGSGTVTTNYPLSNRADRMAKVTSILFKDSAYSNSISSTALDSELYLQVNTQDGDTSRTNTCVVKLTSTTTDKNGIYLTLTETGPATGDYRSNQAKVKDDSDQSNFFIGATNAETVTATSLTDPTRTIDITVGEAAPPSSVTLSQPETEEIKEKEITLKWSKFTGGDFDSYKIYVSKNADVTTDNYMIKKISDVNTVTTTITVLSPKMQYYFKVFVFTSQGTSAGSNEINITTLDPTGDDTTAPPTPVITQPTSATIKINITPYKISGTCDSADTDEILINMQTSGVVYTAGQPSWEATVNLKEGVNKINVTARDADDNESGPATVTITLDTTPPLSPVILQPNNGNNYLTSDKTITLEGITPLETKTLLVNSTTSEVTYTSGETVWTASITLSEGVNTIYVKARDDVGNDSLPATIVITLDSTPPTDPVFTNPNKGYDFITSTTPIRLYGECDPTCQEVRINGKADGVSYTTGGSLFSVEMALTEGLNTFTVQCTDHLGNDTLTDEINIIYYSQVPEKWFESKIFSSTLTEDTKIEADVAKNEFHIVWSQEISSNTQIFYKSSFDSLTTYEQTQQLTTTTGNSSDPDIAVNDSRLFISWTDERDGNKEIYFKTSFDKGVTWNDDVKITANSAACHSSEICLTSSGVHLIWIDNTPGDSEVFYIRSTDSGVSWSAIKQLTQVSGNSSNPRLYEHDNILYLIWQDDRNGYPDLYLKTSDDHGNTWSDEKMISNNNSVCQNPDFSVDNNGIHVVWEDNRTAGDMEIYYMCSTDFGVSWGDEISLSNSTGASSNPRIISNGINLFVTWQDNATGANEIMFRRTNSSGTAWATAENVTSTGKNSKYPAITCNNNGIHLFWWDTKSYQTDEYGHIWTNSWATFAPKVIINELQFSDIAEIELYNTSKYSIHMDAWKFRTGSLSYTFPSDFFLSSEAFLILHEGNGADDDDNVYLGMTIPWTQNSGGHCYLADATQTPYDFVRWGVDTTSPTSGTNWLGANPVNPSAGKNLGRDFNSNDTDFSDDWTAQDPSMGTTNYDDSGNAVLSVQTAKSSSVPYTGFWESKLHDGSKVFNSEFATRNSTQKVDITFDLGSDYLINRILHFNDGQYGARAITVEYATQASPDNWYPLVSGPLDYTADNVNADTFTFTDTIARHIKFTYTTFNDPAWFQLCEIEIWGQDTGSIGSAKLNPVSAVSVPTGFTGFGADQLIDNNKVYNSDFAVKNLNSAVTITIDLGSDCTVDKITLFNDGQYGARECVLKYAVSSEPENWKTSNNFTNLNITDSQPSSTDFILSPAITAQLVKFEFSSAASFNNPTWFQLNEIEVYGKTGATTQTQVEISNITSSITPYPGFGEDKLKDGSKIYNSEFALKIPSDTVTNPVFLVCDLNDDLTISKINCYNDGEYGGKNIYIEYSTSSDPDSWTPLGTYTFAGTASQVNLSTLNFTAFTARFVKFTFKSFYNPSWLQLCELEFFGLGGTSVTYVKEPISSASSNKDTYSGYGADQLYNSEKIFNSDYAVDHQGGPIVIELDFGTDKQLSRMKHYNDGQYGAKSVTIEYSTAAAPTTWSSLNTYPNLRSIQGSPSLDTFDFSKTTLRKLRLTYNDFYDAKYFQINEIEAYSQSSAKTLASSSMVDSRPMMTHFTSISDTPIQKILPKKTLLADNNNIGVTPVSFEAPILVLSYISGQHVKNMVENLKNSDCPYYITEITSPVKLIDAALTCAYELLIIPSDFKTEPILKSNPEYIEKLLLVKQLFSNSRMIIYADKAQDLSSAQSLYHQNPEQLNNVLLNLRTQRYWDYKLIVTQDTPLWFRSACNVKTFAINKTGFTPGQDTWQPISEPGLYALFINASTVADLLNSNFPCSIFSFCVQSNQGITYYPQLTNDMVSNINSAFLNRNYENASGPFEQAKNIVLTMNAQDSKNQALIDYAVKEIVEISGSNSKQKYELACTLLKLLNHYKSNLTSNEKRTLSEALEMLIIF